MAQISATHCEGAANCYISPDLLLLLLFYILNMFCIASKLTLFDDQVHVFSV